MVVHALRIKNKVTYNLMQLSFFFHHYNHDYITIPPPTPINQYDDKMLVTTHPINYPAFTALYNISGKFTAKASSTSNRNTYLVEVMDTVLPDLESILNKNI